jgi:hypothetical protein
MDISVDWSLMRALEAGSDIMLMGGISLWEFVE